MRRCYLLVASFPAFLLLTCWGPGAAFGEEVIKLGGLRNVTATVSASDDSYRVVVEMLAVKAFDRATNNALNLAKGRIYAAQALLKHLKADNLTIRGMIVRESGTIANTFRLVAVVSRNGMSTGKAGTVATHAPETPEIAGAIPPPTDLTRLPQTSTPSRQHEIRLTADATTADFLNRKADYLDTIVRLQEALSEEGDSLERQCPKPEDFYDSIGSVEERVEAAFKALARQIDEDKLLSDLVEREELRPALKKAHAEVLHSLKAAVAQFDERQEKARKEKRK